MASTIAPHEGPVLRLETPESPKPMAAHEDRLAELVTALTDCSPDDAVRTVASVRSSGEHDEDPLATVARAMVLLRRAERR